jgi:hypothetical protein
MDGGPAKLNSEITAESTFGGQEVTTGGAEGIRLAGFPGVSTVLERV